MVVNPFVQGFLSELEKDAGLRQKLMAGVAAAGMCVGGGCAKPVERAVIRAAKPIPMYNVDPEAAIEHAQGIVDSIANHDTRAKMQGLVNQRKDEHTLKKLDSSLRVLDPWIGPGKK